MNKSFFQMMKGPVCRQGRNGPWHPSHIIGIRLVDKGESLIDLGCGSATTTECIRDYFPDKKIKYLGTDFIHHRVDWCRKYFPEFKFEVQDATDIKKDDNSFDVVWARHVLEHLSQVEEPIREWMRVAKKKVIITLFNSWGMQSDHEIKHITWRDKKGLPYDCDEYLNILHRGKMIKFLESLKPEWNYKLIENIGSQGKPIPNKQHFPPRDIIIYLYK